MTKLIVISAAVFFLVVVGMAVLLNETMSDKKVSCEVGQAIFHNEDIKYNSSDRLKKICKIIVDNCLVDQVPKICAM